MCIIMSNYNHLLHFIIFQQMLFFSYILCIDDHDKGETNMGQAAERIFKRDNLQRIDGSH